MNQTSGVFHISKRCVGATLTVLCLAIVGCSSSTSNNSGGGGGTSPIQQQTATPSFTPNGGTFTAAQSVSITDSTPGAVITYTTTVGSTTSSPATYSTPFTVSVTTTVTATALAPSTSSITYTQSSAATATFTINVPVPQSLSFSNNGISMPWSSATMPLPGLTGSSSCPPASTTVTVLTKDTTNAVVAGAQLASWSADSTNTTYGTINRGNAFSNNRFNTYTVTATCGTATASTTLTISDPAPTIGSLNPMTCKGSCTIDVTGSGYIGFNNPSGAQNGWDGTLYATSLGACPTTQPTLTGSSTWFSDTHIQILASNTGVGSWNLSLINQTTADNTGGGWVCQANAYVHTAMVSSTASAHNVTASTNSTTGALVIQTNGGKSTLGSFNLGRGADSPIVTADAVYAVSPANHSIAKFDLASNVLSYIQTPGYNPAMVVQTLLGGVYTLATVDGQNSLGALLRVDGAYAISVASADGFTSIETSENRVLWTVPSKDKASSRVYAYNADTSKIEAINTLSRPADTLVALPGGGLLAYHVGDSQASYLDSESFAEDATVSFSAGLLLPNRGLVNLPSGELVAAVGMTDGTISSVGVVVNQPAYTTLTSKSTVLADGIKPDQLYSGFSIVFPSNSLVPQVRTAPSPSPL